jgi:hypothetical protein
VSVFARPRESAATAASAVSTKNAVRIGPGGALTDTPTNVGALAGGPAQAALSALPMMSAVVVAPATKPKNGPKSRVDGKPGM